MSIHLAGGGVYCALGRDAAAVTSALHRTDAGPAILDLPGIGSRPYFVAPDGGPREDRDFYAAIDRCVEDALCAAALPAARYPRTALFVGTSSMDVGLSEQHYRAALAAAGDTVTMPLPLGGCASIARHVRERFGLGGPEFTFNTACTSSANGAIYAAEYVAAGMADAAIVLGVELFNDLTVHGFNSLQLLSETQCRPFDAQRDGIVLGEAVAAVVVSREREKAARWQGVRLLGGANGCDPKGMTCASAHSMASVMRKALQDAGMDSDARPALIKAHGTGSRLNDAAESAAMRAVFGEACPDITGLKGALGHTLGASGVLELVVMVETLRAGTIPAAARFREPDPDGCTLLRTPQPFSGGNVMFNYFGFGGNSSSFIVAVD